MKKEMNKRNAVKMPKVVSSKAWEAARRKLLVKEKKLTRARDALAAERRRMPWLAVEKEYEFDGPKGNASLLDLFDGRRQLIVYRASLLAAAELLQGGHRQQLVHGGARPRACYIRLFNFQGGRVQHDAGTEGAPGSSRGDRSWGRFRPHRYRYEPRLRYTKGFAGVCGAGHLRRVGERRRGNR